MNETSSLPSLALTPFEEYMLADDRPRWPMTFFLKAEVRGQLDHEAWRQALAETALRHPLLHRLLEGNEATGYRWSTKVAPAPVIRWGRCDEPLAFPTGRMIDLRREGGVRVSVRQGDDRTAIWFEFHHSCCDGMGGTRFIADSLTAYNLLVRADDGEQLRALRPERLSERGRFGITWWRQLLRLPQELLALVGVLEFFSHRPRSLVTGNEQASSADSGGGPLWLAHQFDGERLKLLRDQARARGVTLNDLLVTCLFAALREWFVAHAPDAAGKVGRIMVPMNLRLPGDEDLPAANVVCMINLDRRMNEKATFKKLLKMVSLEMGIVKRCRLGLTFHHILGIAQRLSRIPRLLPTDRCLSTCVLSNLGEPMAGEQRPSAGSGKAGLQLVSLALLPPLRPYTAAAFGVVSHGDTTTITLHYDPALTEERAKFLLQALLWQIETSLAAA
ncbi:MAG TPA: hypothetical protein VGN12_24890 [Pirellulales bacterium]|jgi:hypothetical protein